MTTQTVLTETSSEWTSACEVQRQFMQHSRLTLDTLDYDACCRQMLALGGDFYDFVPLAENCLAIAIGDASGKGLAAALMISNVQSSLRTAAFFAGHDGPTVLDVVNRQLYGSSRAEQYATLFYGVFDSAHRTLRYVNAGHNPPMVVRRDSSMLWLETGGAPVGMFPDWKYAQGVVELHPGDVVLAYTDGVTEATNPDGEEWGVEGARRVVAECEGQCAGTIVDAVLISMDKFTRDFQTDDVTVVALQVH